MKATFVFVDKGGLPVKLGVLSGSEIDSLCRKPSFDQELKLDIELLKRANQDVVEVTIFQHWKDDLWWCWSYYKCFVMMGLAKSGY
jgi:hypothetical protein